MSQTDEALIRQSQQGSRPAFEQLVRHTARLVFSRIYLETGDAQRAEDLVQETFLTAWRSIGQVDRPEGFRTWLMTIAHTVVVDAGRREGRKKRSGQRVGDEALREVAAPDPPPPEVAQRHEEQQQVLAMLKRLPEEYRMPLTLRYIAGADYQTIGRQLGLSNGSLRGLLNRGMNLLREELARCERTADARMP